MNEKIILNELYKFKINISSKEFSESYFFENIIHFTPYLEKKYLKAQRFQIFNFSDLISFNPLLSNSMKKYYIDYLILFKYSLSKNTKNTIYRLFLLPKIGYEIDYINVINKLFLFLNNNYYSQFLSKYINSSEQNLIYKLSFILQKIQYPNILFVWNNQINIKDLVNNINNKCIKNSNMFFECDLFKYSIMNIEDYKNREILICLYYLAYTFPQISNIIKNIFYILFLRTINIQPYLS